MVELVNLIVISLLDLMKETLADFLVVAVEIPETLAAYQNGVAEAAVEENQEQQAPLVVVLFLAQEVEVAGVVAEAQAEAELMQLAAAHLPAMQAHKEQI